MTPEALEARAKREEQTYGQKELPAMLRAGAEAMREVEWWREMAWRLRSYTVHDDNCSYHKPPHYAGCTCKLRDHLSRMDTREAALQEKPHD